MTKEATARIKINKLLDAAGWRFFADGSGAANIRLEPSVTIKSADLDALGENFEKIERGFVDFLLLDARGFPLLVLEAKAEAKNPLVGKEQARKYARGYNCRRQQGLHRPCHPPDVFDPRLQGGAGQVPGTGARIRERLRCPQSVCGIGRAMSTSGKTVIEVQGTAVTVLTQPQGDCISLTDMLKAKDGEFAAIKSQVGLNSYKLSVKEWVSQTGAISLRASAGRYGGTYAHRDIAFEFGMWISPERKGYQIAGPDRNGSSSSKDKICSSTQSH